MAGGNIIDEVKQIDGDGNIAKIDAITGAIYTVPLSHGIIHEGNAYFLSHKAVVSKNSTYDILLLTPPTNSIHLMMHKVVTTVSPGEVCLFESSTVSTSGSPLTPHNCDRDSSNTSSTLMYSAPTGVTLGTELDCDFITGAKLEGGITTGTSFEWILQANEKYIVRYQNASGITADANFSFFYLEV